MTNDELMTMADLWDAGTSVAQIAREMGYSRHTIAYVAYQDRALFPRRHKSFTQSERDRWADRVLSGELTKREVARRKGGESNRRRNDRRWGHIDESIGRAVNQCALDGVAPTRQNVADRMTMDGCEVTRDNVLRWTRKDASTKWRVRQSGPEWVVYCTDDSWAEENV